MMLAAVGWLLAQSCLAASPWCDVDAPCRLVRHARDSEGIESVEIEEEVPGSLPVESAFAVWLVYPGFQPFPAAVGAFRQAVGTPQGTFTACVLPSVAARQRRSEGPALEGGLALLAFDPARRQPARFPLDAVFATARAEGLLTAAQERSLDELDRVASRRAEDLQRALRELAESPHLAHSRKQLLDAIVGFDDPLPVASRDDLRPERFFDREQRPALRRKGHAIRGRCSLVFLPRSARVELSACPLSQLADAWSRSAAEKGTLPDLLAEPGRGEEEIDRVSLELVDVSPPTAARLVYGLLSAVSGLAPAQGTAR